MLRGHCWLRRTVKPPPRRTQKSKGLRQLANLSRSKDTPGIPADTGESTLRHTSWARPQRSRRTTNLLPERISPARTTGPPQLVLPPDIANANAAFLPTDAPAEATDSQLVSADQLNDLDRALTETSPPAPLLTLAAASTPAAISAPATVNAAVSSEDNAWSKSSIIGKIFIAFGGLLTLASAARMFMA